MSDETSKHCPTVRKTSSLDTIDIRYLTDIANPGIRFPKKLSDSLGAHDVEIKKLRQELEGNAPLYRALESNWVLMPDILAVRIEKANRLFTSPTSPEVG